jgi:hypothetical protein
MSKIFYIGLWKNGLPVTTSAIYEIPAFLSILIVIARKSGASKLTTTIRILAFLWSSVYWYDP